MITPTQIHLTTGDVLHVVDDDCIINEETGSCVAVTRRGDEEHGVLIPASAIAYYELPPGAVRVVLEAARHAGAGGSVKS